MSTDTGLSSAWLDDEDVEEEEETVFTGESNFIQGYGVQTVKITMAKRLINDKTKTEFIELDFINKEGKTLREKYMVRGRDGNPYFIVKGTKKQHFGVSKIKGLIRVLGLYPDAKNLMKELYTNVEDIELTYEEYGKEVTETFTVFNDLINKKVKICVTSKKENSQMASEQDDPADQKYVNQCIKDTDAYKKAHPKKKSLKKFDKDDDYVNVYRWFTVTSVSHFCSLKGLFGSEMKLDEGVLLDKFINANDDGEIFEGRTLIVEDLSDAAQTRLGIDEYGKRIVPDDDDDDDDDGYDDEEEEDDEPEPKPKAKTRAKAKTEPESEEEKDEEPDESDDEW